MALTDEELDLIANDGTRWMITKSVKKFYKI